MSLLRISPCLSRLPCMREESKPKKQPVPDRRMSIGALLNHQKWSKEGCNTLPTWEEMRSENSGSDYCSLTVLERHTASSVTDACSPESNKSGDRSRRDAGQEVNIFKPGDLSPIIPFADPVLEKRSQQSVSSLRKSNGSCYNPRRRPTRLRYKEEEMYFVWYLRVDQGREWKDVCNIYNQWFPRRQRDGVQGLQSSLYRFMQRKRCPSLREQRAIMKREASTRGAAVDGKFAPRRFCAIQWATVQYPWMRERCQSAGSIG